MRERASRVITNIKYMAHIHTLPLIEEIEGWSNLRPPIHTDLISFQAP